MSETPAALQLRYLQTLTTISAEHNSTVIFPFPIDLMSSFMSMVSHNQPKVNYTSSSGVLLERLQSLEKDFENMQITGRFPPAPKLSRTELFTA